jgi:hypothetical protein
LEIKTFEIRDRMTVTGVLAFTTEPETEADHFLLSRHGYKNQIFVTDLETGITTWDVHKWTDRSLKTAHDYIYTNFYSMESGAVIDVEHILGEIQVQRQSARFGN